MRSCLEHAQKRGTKDIEKIDDMAPYRVSPKRQNVLTSLCAELNSSCPRLLTLFEGQTPMRGRISWGNFPYSKAKVSDLMSLVLMFI